jgi:hypothetical protein
MLVFQSYIISVLFTQICSDQFDNFKTLCSSITQYHSDQFDNFMFHAPMIWDEFLNAISLVGQSDLTVLHPAISKIQ